MTNSDQQPTTGHPADQIRTPATDIPLRPAIATSATVAQPFYTSKTFWTLILGLAFNVASQLGWIKPGIDATTITNTALLILGLVFRWGADQPLGVGSDAVDMPAATGK